VGHHHHTHAATRGILWTSLAVTLAFTVFEVYAGWRAGSLALLSDAGHNFIDAVALLLAAIGLYFQGKPADRVRTFGYQRAGVVCAFVNAVTLIVISLYIFWEAGSRLVHPRAVDDRFGSLCSH
jgi:cobalt-zinc-cadmium efflux system protein